MARPKVAHNDVAENSSTDRTQDVGRMEPASASGSRSTGSPPQSNASAYPTIGMRCIVNLSA